MNPLTCLKASKTQGISFNRVFFFSLLFVVLNVGSVAAGVPGSMTFSWQANPDNENVIGYRLYYGAYSRFYANGVPKQNFSYDHYIDFTDQLRCNPWDLADSCELLTLEELQCINLYGQVPKCTVSKLHGDLFFALTAYNAQAESDYTPELKVRVNPAGLAAAQQALNALLLQKNK